MLNYDISKDEFKSILELGLKKQSFENVEKFYDSMNRGTKDVVEFIQFVYMFEQEIYQKFRTIVENNWQISFMRNSMIEKMESRRGLEYEQIKEYPHLAIYFYQKNKDSEEY